MFKKEARAQGGSNHPTVPASSPPSIQAVVVVRSLNSIPGEHVPPEEGCQEPLEIKSLAALDPAMRHARRDGSGQPSWQFKTTPPPVNMGRCPGSLGFRRS